MRERGLRLAIAESCTGGLIGHRITNIAGSSTFYMGSITAYAYEAKVRLLDVQWPTRLGATAEHSARFLGAGNIGEISWRCGQAWGEACFGAHRRWREKTHGNV